MGMIFEDEIRDKVIMATAENMLTAARTAPKSRGVDNLVISIAEKDTIEKIADKMMEMFNEGRAQEFFVRDSNNIRKAGLIVLIGTKINPMGLQHCGLCGFKDCAEKTNSPDHPCALNTTDLGIAIGSAVSVAADARVDSRVMFSVGMAVRELGLMGDDVKVIFAIPLSVSKKNPFFDRK